MGTTIAAIKGDSRSLGYISYTKAEPGMPHIVRYIP